jgi:hypothetical protein
MSAGQIDVRQLAGSQEHRVVDGQGYFPVIAHLGAEELVVALRGGAPHIGLQDASTVCAVPTVDTPGRQQ